MPTATNTRRSKVMRRVKLRTHFPDQGTASVAEAMEFLGIGKTKIYELISDEKGPPAIPSFMEGDRRLFDWRDLWAYHEARKRARARHPGTASRRSGAA